LLSDEAKVVDVFLKLDADFERQVLDGSVTLTIEKVKPEATHVVSGGSWLTLIGYAVVWLLNIQTIDKSGFHKNEERLILSNKTDVSGHFDFLYLFFH
jgi:hypothetical protein